MKDFFKVQELTERFLTQFIAKHQQEKLKRKLDPFFKTTRIRALYNHLKYNSWDIFSMIYIETITACNRRCVYCPNSKFDRGLIKNTKNLETELFYKIIDQLAQLGWVGDVQPHYYGEPLLDDRLLAFTKYTKKRLPTSSISIFTNGDFLTINLYKNLIDAGVSRFVITQHSEKLSNNVKNVLDYRKKETANIVEVCHRKLDIISNRGGLIKVKTPVKLKKCSWTPSTIGVDYEGNVLLCCNDYFSTVTLGNIKNERLIDIWRKPHYRKLRKDLKQGIFELELCKKCWDGHISN